VATESHQQGAANERKQQMSHINNNRKQHMGVSG